MIRPFLTKENISNISLKIKLFNHLSFLIKKLHSDVKNAFKARIFIVTLIWLSLNNIDKSIG